MEGLSVVGKVMGSFKLMLFIYAFSHKIVIIKIVKKNTEHKNGSFVNCTQTLCSLTK